MKKVLFATGLLMSSMVFADVDYSRCLMGSGLYGAQIDNDGKIQFGQWQKVKSQKTEGKKETYVVEAAGFGGSPISTEYSIERDDQGHIVKVSTGGDKMDPKSVKAYKDSVVNNSIYMGTSAQYMGAYGGYVGGVAGGFGYGGGFNNQYQAPDFMTSEPQFFVDGKMVPLSKLSKEDAKKAGFDGNIEALQKAKQQWRKDKKVVGKIKNGYSKIVEKSALVIPMGQESEFEVKDGVCLVKNVAYKSYNSKTKEVVKTPGVSREQCEKIQNIHKKYATKLNECQDVQMKMGKEYFEKGVYDGGGLAGGYVTGGYPGGMVGGYGVGLGMGSMSSFQCQALYGVGAVEFAGETGGIQGGHGASSKPNDSSKQ